MVSIYSRDDDVAKKMASQEEKKARTVVIAMDGSKHSDYAFECK